MSEHVLTTDLVDFGSSLWRSSAIANEFPGLASRGMKAIGRFGIGFFSVFMIASEVRVITRRFDHAAADALKLLFNQGVDSRPILAQATADEAPRNGGTRVELKLLGDPSGKDEFRFVLGNKRGNETDAYLDFLYKIELRASSLAQLVAQIAPCSDTTIKVSVDDKTLVAVHANDWLSCHPNEIPGRVGTPFPSLLVNNLSKLVTPITEPTGEILGRGALWPSISYTTQSGVLVSSGFRVQSIPHIAGFVRGDVETAARNVGSLAISQSALKSWSSEQARLISKLQLSGEHRALSAEVVLELGGRYFKPSYHKKRKHLVHEG